MTGPSPIRKLLPGLDPRPIESIDRDLDDEFSFHLDALERELVNEGNSPGEARRLARHRFGDVERIRADCRRLALQERIMLQRFNAVLMMIVLAVVAALAIHVFLSQRETSRSLERISTQLAAISGRGTPSLEERYRERALAAEQRADSEAAKARAVQDFLTDVFVSADPASSRVDVDVNRVLDAAARRLQEIDLDPAIEASLRETLAGARERIEDPLPARDQGP